MNSFLFSINELPDNIRNLILESYELDPNLLHFVIFETSEVEEVKDFEEYLKKNGFPSDIKIRVLANCYPKGINCEGTTNDITSVSF